MALAEIYPHLHRIVNEKINPRLQAFPQDPNSTTVQLMNNSFATHEHQTLRSETDRRPKKFMHIADKLNEEVGEIVSAWRADGKEAREQRLVDESQQWAYYAVMGVMYFGHGPEVLIKMIDSVSEELAGADVPPEKIDQNAVLAVARIGQAALMADRMLVVRRTAEAYVAVNRIWEREGISPAEVGAAM